MTVATEMPQGKDPLIEGNRVIEGGCLCGAIRYGIDGPVMPAVHCHCSMCRRASGALFVTWISVAARHFRFVRGEPRLYVSSAKGERRFCGTCGAQLTWSARPAASAPAGETDSEGMLDVTVGTLDHPERHPADHHIFFDDRITWLRLDDALPAHGGEGPPASLDGEDPPGS